MKEVKLGTREKLDLELNNRAWTVSKWEKFSQSNDVGIIIEGGKVTGYEPNPKFYHI